MKGGQEGRHFVCSICLFGRKRLCFHLPRLEILFLLWLYPPERGPIISHLDLPKSLGQKAKTAPVYLHEMYLHLYWLGFFLDNIQLFQMLFLLPSRIKQHVRWERDSLGVWDWHVHTALFKTDNQDFPGDSVVKNPPAYAGDTGSIPGRGRSHMPWSN